jgi:hypothetical protein
MSQLRVSATGQPDFYLNVLSFDSPIVGEMNSGQTRTQVQYFPIKSMQNDLVCQCIFPNEVTWQQWQNWVYQLQINAQMINTTGGLPGVQLNWPERGINQWSAIIPKSEAGGRRANYAPRISIQFQLIVNMVSNLTVFQSFGTGWQSLYANNYLNGSILDSLLNVPDTGNFGAVTPGNAAIIANNASNGNTATTNGSGVQVPGVSYPASGGVL